jgi:hypothetical protein
MRIEGSTRHHTRGRSRGILDRFGKGDRYPHGDPDDCQGMTFPVLSRLGSFVETSPCTSSFRAAEGTFQMLCRLPARPAGRFRPVILQTSFDPDHEIIQCAASAYESFERDSELRRELLSALRPPDPRKWKEQRSRLKESHKDRSSCQAAEGESRVQVMGPAPSPRKDSWTIPVATPLQAAHGSCAVFDQALISEVT